MGDFLSLSTDGNAELPFGTQTGQSGSIYLSWGGEEVVYTITTL